MTLELNRTASTAEQLNSLLTQIMENFSVSDHEGPLTDEVEAFLNEQEHLTVRRHGDTVVASTDFGKPSRVILAGHLDTVPVIDNFPPKWLEPGDSLIREEIAHAHPEDRVLWGRGATDMKASDAVMLYLAATLDGRTPETTPKVDLTYVFYDHEEVVAEKNGLRKVVEAHPDWITGDFAIIGEPTNSGIEGGCNGTIRFDVVTHGVAAHSARHLAVFAGPERGPVNRHDRHQKPASALEAAGQRFHVPGTRANTFNAVDFPEVWGLPRFKERPFLYSRAFIPSPDLVAAVQRLVPQEPAEARTFFQSAGNVAALETLVAGFSPDRLGTLESEAARRSRVHEELGACAETLRRELGHPVRSLCWPWGSGSEVAREEGRKAGFSVFFTTRMGANPPAAPEAVHRFKVRDAGWSWLRLRLEIYSRPWLARLYGACRI